MKNDKKYYYIKINKNFFDSDIIKTLETMPDGVSYSNILLKLYLKSLDDNGRLMFRENYPYNPAMLAKLTGHKEDTVKNALEEFKKLGLIEILENGAIYMLDFEDYVGASGEEAKRKKEYKARIDKEKQLLKLQINASDQRAENRDVEDEEDADNSYYPR